SPPPRRAWAPLWRPNLVIFEEPFMGLDSAGRRDVADLLGGLLAAGVRLLLITQPNAIPDWVTHVLELKDQAIRWQGPRLLWNGFANRPANQDGLQNRPTTNIT